MKRSHSESLCSYRAVYILNNGNPQVKPFQKLHMKFHLICYHWTKTILRRNMLSSVSSRAEKASASPRIWNGAGFWGVGQQQRTVWRKADAEVYQILKRSVKLRSQLRDREFVCVAQYMIFFWMIQMRVLFGRWNFLA